MPRDGVVDRHRHAEGEKTPAAPAPARAPRTARRPEQQSQTGIGAPGEQPRSRLRTRPHQLVPGSDPVERLAANHHVERRAEERAERRPRRRAAGQVGASGCCSRRPAAGPGGADQDQAAAAAAGAARVRRIRAERPAEAEDCGAFRPTLLRERAEVVGRAPPGPGRARWRTGFMPAARATASRRKADPARGAQPLGDLGPQPGAVTGARSRLPPGPDSPPARPPAEPGRCPIASSHEGQAPGRAPKRRPAERLADQVGALDFAGPGSNAAAASAPAPAPRCAAAPTPRPGRRAPNRGALPGGRRTRAELPHVHRMDPAEDAARPPRRCRGRAAPAQLSRRPSFRRPVPPVDPGAGGQVERAGRAGIWAKAATPGQRGRAPVSRQRQQRARPTARDPGADRGRHLGWSATG